MIKRIENCEKAVNFTEQLSEVYSSSSRIVIKDNVRKGLV